MTADNQRDKGHWLALTALAVATMSMLGTVGNFAINARQQRLREAGKILLQCGGSQVDRLLPYDAYFAFDREGGTHYRINDSLDKEPGLKTYSHRLRVTSQCRLSNNTPENASISDFYPLLKAGNQMLSDPSFYLGLQDADDRPLQLPRLLSPREQLAFTIVVGVPVPKAAASAVAETLGGRPNLGARDLLFLLERSGALAKLDPPLCPMLVAAETGDGQFVYEEIFGPW